VEKSKEGIMSVRHYLTRYCKSWVPLQLFLKCLEEFGGDIEDLYIAGGRARLPHGSKIYFWTYSDGGMGYSVSHEWRQEDLLEDIKVVQKAFAKANIIFKTQRQFEQKEERKKGTSEVSEFILGIFDSVHGGDSASGEVPEGESGRGQDSSSSRESALPLELEAGSGQEEESAKPSDASGLSPDLPSKKEGGESCASDSSERESASEGEGSSGDGACPKLSECASLCEIGERDAPIDGQASIGEGTGSFAPSPEGVLKEILGEEPGELSTLPSPSGAQEGEASEPEGEVSPSLSFKDLKKIMNKGYSTPSVHSRNFFGGICANMESLNGIPPKELVNKARRVFARLVSFYGEGEEGPCWNYKKVSTRIASYQSWRVSDRKKEVGRPAIAVLPDISGSMSEFSEQVIELSKVLMALGVPGAEVIVIVQSNGYPLELWMNGKKVESFDYFQWNEDYVIEWYNDVFTRFNVKVVILAADWDGEWLYFNFAEKMSIKIYWLDAYLSSKVGPTLVKQFPLRWVRNRRWSEIAARKVKYVYGCHDIVDFIKGLELAIKFDNKK
jgi:hypothetical protein